MGEHLSFCDLLDKQFLENRSALSGRRLMERAYSSTVPKGLSFLRSGTLLKLKLSTLRTIVARRFAAVMPLINR